MKAKTTSEPRDAEDASYVFERAIRTSVDHATSGRFVQPL